MARDIVYWDSCAFSSYFNEEAGKVDDCQSVLKAATEGHVLIVTSALTMAEVLFAKTGAKLDPTKRITVENFFKADYITVRNVTRIVSELARDLFWDYGIKPKDAVHVASAALLKVPVLNTFDDDLINKSGISINDHTIRICKPHYVQQLDLVDKQGGQNG